MKPYARIVRGKGGEKFLILGRGKIHKLSPKTEHTIQKAGQYAGYAGTGLAFVSSGGILSPLVKGGIAMEQSFLLGSKAKMGGKAYKAWLKQEEKSLGRKLSAKEKWHKYMKHRKRLKKSVEMQKNIVSWKRLEKRKDFVEKERGKAEKVLRKFKPYKKASQWWQKQKAHETLLYQYASPEWETRSGISGSLPIEIRKDFRKIKDLHPSMNDYQIWKRLKAKHGIRKVGYWWD